ncbi:MAG: hypothetical protein PHE17_05340 [Thiothrix sp.]|uniref:hypothetical protein n=1 Tax=Thiothrix sp. TaxID=1032 RepID=UPI00260D0593|nr:hypothetical protein [Thiothrix sp.]MDD5392426.1 hypothetical protein [Thiothrix sp.]
MSKLREAFKKIAGHDGRGYMADAAEWLGCRQHTLNRWEATGAIHDHYLWALVHGAGAGFDVAGLLMELFDTRRRRALQDK